MGSTDAHGNSPVKVPMFNRRELLKYFGAGAIAAPVIAGVPDETRMVRIVEPPKIEMPPAPTLLPMDAFMNRECLNATLFLRSGDGRVCKVECDSVYMTNFAVVAHRRRKLES